MNATAPVRSRCLLRSDRLRGFEVSLEALAVVSNQIKCDAQGGRPPPEYGQGNWAEGGGRVNAIAVYSTWDVPSTDFWTRWYEPTTRHRT